MRLESERVPPGRWRRTVVERQASGARFGSLHATAGEVRLLLVLPGGGCTLLITGGAEVESIVADVPAAGWAEREAHDLYGIEFLGHDPMRPLVLHSAEEWRVPVTGGGVHDVAVGPIHAGVIESGHFRFHAVGERILLLDLRLFYKHRGLEKAARGVALDQGIVYAQRACGTCAVANSVAYAQAAETVLGLQCGIATAHARTLLLEMERLYNHLGDLSAICAGIGFAAGGMALAALKERAQRLNQQLFGHRFLFDTVEVGGTSIEISSADARRAGAEVTAIVADAGIVWRELSFNGSVQDRLCGVGVLSHHQALRTGAVGPSARASGVDLDARSSAPDLLYPGFRSARLVDATGDVAARAEMRKIELEATGQLLDPLLQDGIRPERGRRQLEEQRMGFGRVESPRGETVCVVEGKSGGIERFHLRTASYANWPALIDVVPGNLLPEFPLINKSFELCYACVDR
ncbi:MAG TPA: NADH-quinone oxidoreductase subunit C [Candidatus Nitrosotalea sp.]|nr:NADH-quinone oxidoreductase subunit C [Candidatus Nitrosotalea sp.]